MSPPDKLKPPMKTRQNPEDDIESEFLDLISETFPFGVFKWDIVTNSLAVSKSLKDITPLSSTAKTLRIDDLWNCFHPDDLADIKTEIERSFETRILLNKEVRVKTGADSYVWMQLKGRVKHGPGGQAQVLMGTLMDISSAVDLRKKVEQQQSELRFFFDNVPAKIWYKDDTNKITRMNQKAAVSMGISAQDGEGSNMYQLFPETAKKYHNDDMKVIKTGTPLRSIVEEFTPRDGKSTWVRTDRYLYRDPITEEKTVLAMAVDITPEKIIEKKLEQKHLALQAYAQRLENANKELENFAYVASHDLKAPLRSIDNLAAWIEEDLGENLTEGAAEKLALLRGRVMRLEDMLKDILAFSYADKDISTAEYLNIDELLDEVILWLSPPPTTTITRCPDLPNVKMVKTVMEHVFMNLLSNAIKHNPRADGIITIAGFAVNGGTEFIVTDNGPGIAERYHDYVFELFKTLRPRDKVAGSGIGLAIIKKMLESIGGDIWIETPSSGIGTAFHFLIPETIIIPETILKGH